MQQRYILPATGFVRLATVLTVIPVSKSTWWQGIREGRFPQPVKLGRRITAWRVEDIRALIDGRSWAPGAGILERRAAATQNDNQQELS
jgi:prophage regulatory protein